MFSVVNLVVNMLSGKRYQRRCPGRRRKRLHSAPATLDCGTSNKTKRKQWTNESMDKAIQAVKRGRSSVQRAAIEHGVPQQTLHYRISGRVKHGTNPGPKPFCHKLKKQTWQVFWRRLLKLDMSRVDSR